MLKAWSEFASRDPRRVGAVFTADAEWLAPADNATARAIGGTHDMIGRDRIIRSFTSEFGTVFVDVVSIDIRAVFADGDTVIVEERVQATLAQRGHYDNDYCPRCPARMASRTPSVEAVARYSTADAHGSVASMTVGSPADVAGDALGADVISARSANRRSR